MRRRLETCEDWCIFVESVNACQYPSSALLCGGLSFSQHDFSHDLLPFCLHKNFWEHNNNFLKPRRIRKQKRKQKPSLRSSVSRRRSNSRPVPPLHVFQMAKTLSCGSQHVSQMQWSFQSETTMRVKCMPRGSGSTIHSVREDTEV